MQYQRCYIWPLKQKRTVIHRGTQKLGQLFKDATWRFLAQEPPYYQVCRLGTLFPHVFGLSL